MRVQATTTKTYRIVSSDNIVTQVPKEDIFYIWKSVAPLLESGLVWSPDTRWAEEVIEECASFPAGEHDDFVETLAQNTAAKDLFLCQNFRITTSCWSAKVNVRKHTFLLCVL